MNGFERPSAAAVAAVTRELADALGDRCSANETVRRQHAHTLTWGENQPPDCVVVPRDAREVVRSARRRCSDDLPKGRDSPCFSTNQPP